jgi:ribose 5-phosphate isomerase
MSDAKRLAGEKALEYVEDGMVVGVGTGSTVRFFIDALAGIKDRIAGAVSSSEQSTRSCAPTASTCSTSTRPGRWRCTSTAPTSAIRCAG